MENEISTIHGLLTRVLLTGSFVIFAAGASLPAAGGFWGMSFTEGLKWVAENPGRWTMTNVLFIISFLACIAGLALLNQLVEAGTVRAIANAGFAIFLLGTVFWLIDLGFRLAFEPWAAGLAGAGDLPDVVQGLRLLQTTFFGFFMALAFLGGAVYGAALITSPSFSGAAGWFLLAYNVFFGWLFVTTGGPIPIMVLVGPLVLALVPYPA